MPPSAPVYPALHLQSVMTVLASGESELAGHRLSHGSVPKMLLYVPAEQGSHGPRSGPVYPSLHWHVLLPTPGFEDETAEHRVHVSLDVAPDAVEYVPTSHSTHAPLPLISLYVPAGHSSQSPPSGPEKPALHLHSPTAELPAGESDLTGHSAHVSGDVAASVAEYVPASHSWQSVVPFASLYSPTLHATHSFPSASAVYPALQTQSASSSLPLAESVFAGHSPLHSSDPGVALYLPSSHSTHGPPCGP